MVRGPMIAAVPAGCRMTEAIAQLDHGDAGLLGERREFLSRSSLSTARVTRWLWPSDAALPRMPAVEAFPRWLIRARRCRP